MIRLTQLSKHYTIGRETLAAVKGVELHIQKPGIYLLLGPSGSGKSTLLSLIGAMLRPSEGSIEVLGRQIAKLPDAHATAFRRQNLGFVFQSFNLMPELSALENVILPLIPEGRSKSEAHALAYKALAYFAMESKAHIPVRLLSGGERQRVAIARAMAHEPKIILADEPTANLDSANKQLFLQEMERLKALGLTLLIATHDPLFESWPAVDGRFEMQDGRLF